MYNLFVLRHDLEIFKDRAIEYCAFELATFSANIHVELGFKRLKMWLELSNSLPEMSNFQAHGTNLDNLSIHLMVNHLLK